ncbi:MAG: alpha/beta hydrolase [Candidatus Lokiarchaeota archaeon]|nr:alpha/beta hydrolase [Candidatus Lokiarchaeota archaeon]
MEIFNEIEEKYIKINGITLHTIITGSGEPLILLHGFPDFWYGWKNIILGLKDKFQLIVPDMRGYNLSDKPDGIENYKLDILIEDIKGLSEKLGFTKFNLAGHDWGGMVSWALAEKYPEILKKLIILNAPHPKIFRKLITKDNDQKKASGYIVRFLKEGESFLFENNFQALQLSVFGTAKNKKAFSEFDKEKYIEAWSQPGALTGGVNYYKANRSYEEWSGIINVPTLVIFGMKDIFVLPKVLEGLEDFIKDLKIVRIENASHWVMHDDPELVNSSIQSFLRG